MQSRQQSSLRSLARQLKTLLTKYESVYDIVIFGSATKGRLDPKDLDLAVITAKKDALTIGRIRLDIDKIQRNAHLQIITYEDFLKSKLPYNILLEGYSTKGGKFISQGGRSTLYWFDLKNLSQSKKVMFGRAVRVFAEETKSDRIGRGAILVPVNSSSEFEELLQQWSIKAQKKNFVEI